MFDPFGLAEFDSDITAWRTVIRQDAAKLPNLVPAFEPFDIV